MNMITALYTALVLVSVYTCGYSIWCYYECPETRSHRPYVFPIFISVGWFFFAINGLITIAANRSTKMDGYAILLLSVATLVALLIFVYHYRRGRKNETFGKACTIYPADSRTNPMGQNTRTGPSSGPGKKDRNRG